jgi:hypothetical protein
MRKYILWALGFVITIAAAIYQRHTGPTYPKELSVDLNGIKTELKLVRSLALDEKPEVKLTVADSTIKAKIYYKRFQSNDEYQVADFTYKVISVHSFVMNKIFKIYERRGLFAVVPQQPAAGKLQYYFDITDSGGTQTLLKETPVVIRFKGGVPTFVLIPHILVMFLAMFFSTVAGMMAAVKYPLYRKYGLWTLILMIAGGMILGPIIQYYAFGDFWTGVPFGWDLTDNKTLLGLLFWIAAVWMNRKSEKPIYTILAAVMLLIVFSIPHSLFGSQLNYSTGEVTQGMILNLF